MDLLKIALSKGRILAETLELFNKINMDCDGVSEDSRKLFLILKNTVSE